MADTKLAKVGITVKEPWADNISYEPLDYTLWMVQDGGDGCGYIAKRANIGVVPNSDDSVWIKATQAGQSIYDLAVKYGHFVGTEEEFEAEYQAVLQAARDAASETSATNTEIQEAEELRKTAENARVEAETSRQSAETARQSAETARETEETARQTAEAQREENETDRESQEATRESAETDRQSNESTRQSNEIARESAEQERVADFEALETDMRTAIGEADEATAAAVALNNLVAGDEADRQSAESGRVAAETQRVSNENGRASAETTRQTQETARQTAEQTRNTQETARQTAEGQRATAEQGRASAESGRVSAEQSRVAAETAREEQATTDHQRAESDHAIAEEDHSTLDEKIAHKADIDGSYDSMAVGLAKNLEGRTNVTDSFFERTTGGDAEVANGTAQLNEVKGKSQVWNQLMPDNDWSSEGWATLRGDTSVENGVVRVTCNANGQCDIHPKITVPTIANHKYCVIAVIRTNGKRAIISTVYSGTEPGTTSSEFVKLSMISSRASNYNSPYPRILISTAVVGDWFEVKSFVLFDLTLLGIDNLTTVQEVEAWLAENIGEQAYYPYNPGEVLNNRMTGVESIGFNLLDPVTGKADILGAYSDVYGNYYGITGTHGTLTFTDKFGNTETITPDDDGKFLLEKAGTLSVADAGEDCAVFLWWDGTQTEYKPYEKNVGALDVTHIYGKLNGEGEYVRVWPTGMPGIGDIKDSIKVVDGQVVAERKVGEVDMGTLNWNGRTFGSNSGFVCGLSGGVATTGANGVGNAVCKAYPVVKNYGVLESDKVMAVGAYWSTGSNVYVSESAYSDAATFKTAMNGVLLYFELATPQVFTDLVYRDSESFADGTPVTLPVNYKVDNWGIERIAPQNTEEAVVTTKPELTMRYSIDAVEELNTHRDEIDDLYDKNEELDQRKPEKYGEYPDMAVGSAKTLAGQDTKVEDFFFKALDCADGLAKLNSARGKSLVWNQLVKNGNFDNGTTGWSFSRASGSVANNECTITTGTQPAATTQFSQNVSILGGHKYYIAFDFAGLVSEKLRVLAGGSFAMLPTLDYTSSTNTRVKGISTASSSQSFVSFYPNSNNTSAASSDICKVKNIILIDLTLMFGAGNEPATVEEFEAMFPLPYYAYNPGEIISNKTEEVKVVGFNQWDEEWELGGLDQSTGANTTRGDCFRSKNYIDALPGDYYIKSFANNTHLCEYDAAKNFIRTQTQAYNRQITLSDNCRYIRFYVYGYTTYTKGVNIGIYDSARNGEYEPYKTNTIELNLPTLTGKLNGEGESVVVFPDGLKSAGSVYDEIVGNKAIKRVGKIVLDGTENVVKSNSNEDGHFRLDVSDIKPQPQSAQIQQGIVSSHYTANIGVWSANFNVPMSIGGHPTLAVLYFYNGSNITTVAEFKAWLAAQYSAGTPVVVYYELATPEEYILDAPLPDTFQAYKGGTIKQLPENTSEPVTAPMVMDVTYSLDAVGILTGLPKNYISLESLQAMLNAMQSAGLFTSYTLTWNESQGKYNFTFQANQ